MPDLSFQVERPSGDLTVLRLEGEFEGMAALDAKEKLLGEIKKTSTKNFWMDFAEIGYIDSTGVGILLEMAKIASSKKIGFGLIHVGEPVKKVLAITHVDKVIPILAV